MFVVTTAGVIVVDPMSTTHATQMLAAIREVSSQPVSYVAYSHNHWDHTGGAAVFQPRWVTVENPSIGHRQEHHRSQEGCGLDRCQPQA